MNQIFSNVIFAGVDIGFGATKSHFWHESGFEEKYIIPSIVASGHDRMFARLSTGGADPYNSKLSDAQNQLNYLHVDIENLTTGESNSWFLGRLAIQEGKDQSYSWQDNKSSDTKSLALLVSQLAVAQTARAKGESSYSKFYVSTGLPIKHYRAYASAYENNLIGKWKVTFKSGVWAGVSCTLYIISCRTYPQAYGIYNDQMIDMDGCLISPELLDDYVLVVDPGTRTTEYALFKDGVMQDAYSDSIERGMSTALSLIQDKLGEHGLVVKDYDIDLCFIEKDGILVKNGVEVDLNPIRKAVLKEVSTFINDELKKELKDVWDMISLTVIGGGTGELLFEHLNFPNMRLATSAQFGNASGYLKLAKEIAATTISELASQKGMS